MTDDNRPSRPPGKGRPFKPRQDRAGGGRAGGDRPYGDRPPRRTYRDDSAGQERPRESSAEGRGRARSFEDRPPRRNVDDRPPRREGEERPQRRTFRERDDAAPRRSFDDRPPRRDFGDRPPRRTPRDGDERAPRRAYDDRPPRRDFDDSRPPRREYGDRPPRSPEGARPPRREYGERPPRRDFGDSAPPRREYRDRPPRQDREDRPFREKPFRDASSGSRPYGDKRPGRPSASGKPYAGKPTHGRLKTDQEASAPRKTGGEGQRIAKMMARAGLCSRRDAEDWILAGRVSVDGRRIDSPALDILPGQTVLVDGKPLPEKEKTRLWLFHKPVGLVTTDRDPEGRPTVFESLPPGLPRVMSVGRLDINTEGLLLLTNDGGLARVLEHPSTGWLRRYRARAYGRITQEALDGLSEGVTIDGMDYGPVEASLDKEQGDNAWITIGIREGKNREVKVILEHLGLQVNRLIRISFGPFKLEDLPEGQVDEVRTKILKDQLGERLAEEAGVDFDAPIRALSPRRTLEERTAKSPSSWREPGADDAPRKPRRKLDKTAFSDRRRAASLGETPDFRMETGATAARSGKTVQVERIVRNTPTAEDRPEKGRDFDSDRPRKRYSERAPREDRADGDRRPPRAGREEGRFRPPSDRDRRQDQRRDRYADRPPREEAENRGPRRDFGDRPPRRDFGDRPPRRDFGDRPPRSDFSDRPPRKGPPRQSEGSGRASGSRSPGERPFGGRPSGNRPSGGRPSGGRPPRKPRRDD